jgi:hypothetical protein
MRHYCFWRKQKPESGPPDRVESAGFIEEQNSPVLSPRSVRCAQ